MLRRLTGILLLLVFTASAVDAVGLCAGMAAAAANPHACCLGDAPKPSTQKEAMECCAMAEQSEARGLIEAVVGLLGGLARHLHDPPGASAPGISSIGRPPEMHVHRGLPSVPIYLQDLTLLI